MKDPLIGQQLANFRVDDVLGHGGMATVYRGFDVKLQRVVAIKVLDKKFRKDDVYNKRFIDEARMMAKWRHENIVQIYYADEEQGYSYYAMEYVDGQDMSSIMQLYSAEGELMPIAEAVRIGRAVANALDYAHRHGVIHRDVKPSNILVSKDGRVLLGDFGMALNIHDGSMGNIFGTPHYISPEQARRSADAVPQSDLYSLGVILYEILTGSTPFNDTSPASIALQHISQNPPSPRTVNPEILPSVESVLLKSLEKDPQNRYQSGTKLMDAFEGAFRSNVSSSKIPLPPLPVGVPTIRHSSLTISQITRREAPQNRGSSAIVSAKPAVHMPATVPSDAPRKRKLVWMLAFIPLLLGFGAWYYYKNGLAVIPNSVAVASPTLSPASTSTEESVLPTQTLPSPSAAPTRSEPTSTSTVEPTLEQPTATVQPIATIKYPNGNHFKLFWNETSFHMLNLSREPRSLSAFVFERLDAADAPTDRYYGAVWENSRFNIIGAKDCVSLKIYGDEDPPYIDPSDCYGRYISIIQPRKDEDREQIFWNQKDDGSHQFRIVFANEEIARCEISAGTCEFYIP